MSTPAELYPAILADPDNLELRLRYADAVQASDPGHAELIRLDIAAEEQGRRGFSLPAEQAKRRRQLTRAIGPRVAVAVAPLVDSWRLRRGFPEVVKLTAEAFLSKAAELYAHAPVRHLILTEVVPYLDELVQSPHLARLSSLDLSGNPIGDAGVATLVRSPHLTKLRYLGLSRTATGSDALETLAATDSLPNLQYVDFGDNKAALNAVPVAQDPISGDLVEVSYPPGNDRLVQTYGSKPWLTEARATADAGLYRPPDYGQV